jgi:hypothetical protein
LYFKKRGAAMKKFIILTIAWLPLVLMAAVGCDLNDPDRDVKRLFPESTGYRTYYLSVQRLGGTALLSEIEEKLGDKFSGLYETIDVPYTMYEIYKDDKVTGYVHGVNQKGRYGGIQIFLALDKDLVIKEFYLQRFYSRFGKDYRSEDFSAGFRGLSIDDFSKLNITTGKGEGKAAEIKSPAPSEDPDFLAIMRGLKKNLILTGYFVSAER